MNKLHIFLLGIASGLLIVVGIIFIFLPFRFEPAPETSDASAKNCNFDNAFPDNLSISANGDACSIYLKGGSSLVITSSSATLEDTIASDTITASIPTSNESGEVNITDSHCEPGLGNSGECSLIPYPQVAPTMLQKGKESYQYTVPAPTSTIIPTGYDHCEDMNASDCIAAYESSYAPFIVETSTYFDLIHSYVASTSIEYTDIIAKQDGRLSIPLSTSSEVYIFRLDCNGTFLANTQYTSGYLDGAYPFDVSKCDEVHVSSILPRQQPTRTEWSCINSGTNLWRNPAMFPPGQGSHFETPSTSTPESLGYSDCTQIN